jgi:hypothetical protein
MAEGLYTTSRPKTHNRQRPHFNMIFHLLTAIAQSLQTGLQAQIPPNAIAVSRGPLLLPQKLPYIRLWPGTLTFPQNGRDTGTIAPNSTQLLIVREFQQEFFIEIYDTAIAPLETITSLILGCILTHQEALLQAYNQGQPDPPLPKTDYAADPVRTHHRLTQLQLLDGQPLALETALGFQLRGMAIGQLTLTRTLPDGTTPIQSIRLTHHV